MKSLTNLTILLATSIAVSAGAATPRDISAWRNSTPPQPDVVLVQGATIWTSGPEGMLQNADLLVRKGKIARVGMGLTVPRGAVVVDGSGKHVTPGLIDAHSHSAIIGGVNEGSNVTTSEVRIGDVVNSESIQIWRQLAGGLTTANLLHGSANSIGGQNAVIKLRWGALPEELKFEGAPQGIKFALGENPKQSNFYNDENPRYPSTRAGVERSIRERFEAATDYREAWETHRQDPSRVPPRRDLQLDALVEIMDGERLVHSHSYRADEIVMLLRVAEDFGFTVGSFQHVLEGYKVADELAAGNAGASTFSDWWAYKYEVVDAIPYNGAIMWDRGVVVSYNSDSSELARRMNTEAAKAVRYGGVPEAEALKFVTLNPAIQLGIADRVGSLEQGKDADFVLWNGHPLSTYTICEQTWIDGRKYFDLEEDREARRATADQRQELLAKVRAESEKDEEKQDDDADEDELPAYILADEDHSETCRALDGQGDVR